MKINYITIDAYVRRRRQELATSKMIISHNDGCFTSKEWLVNANA